MTPTSRVAAESTRRRNTSTSRSHMMASLPSAGATPAANRLSNAVLA
nr:hypothetical protein [Candidatus Microthrix sp.]